MNKLLKLDNIMYFVKDLDKSINFYEQEFGLKKLWRDDNFKMVGLGLSETDTEIVIHNDEKLPNPDFSFLVDNVESFCDEFKKKGHQILFGPIEVRPGKYAILSDLDGNKIPVIDLTKFGGNPRYDQS